MEEIMDFDEWMLTYTQKPKTYVAVYDPETGAVKSVGPTHAFETEVYKIDLDPEVAEMILTAETPIHKCMVDINSNTLEIAEVRAVNKIDNLLHRIILTKDSDIAKPNVYLTYNSTDKTMEFELSEEFGGTRKIEGNSKKRKCVWHGDTEMVFLITEYNDPNLILDTISVTLNDITGQSKVVENKDYSNFSVYTRRLFKNYVLEIK